MENDPLRSDNSTFSPIIFSGNNAENDFTLFRSQWEVTNGELHIIDDYSEEANEFALLLDPALLHGKKDIEGSNSTPPAHAWVVLPWRHTAVRTLEHGAYSALRTSRNHNLITKSELSILARKKIGIAGLNVGNPAVVCLAQEGIGEYFRLADNDTLSLSNLNRFRAGISDLGLNKAVLSARQALEINPFLNVEVWEQGVSGDTLREFVSGLDILIEEMDAPPLKISIREEAKRQGVPTIMVTGNGHDIVLDVERYDQDPEQKILSGFLPDDVRERIANGPQTFDQKVTLAQDFMGNEFLCERLNASFGEVGKTLIGIPQLAEASFLRGAVLAHTARAILLNQPVSSGRYAFGLTDLFNKKLSIQK